MTKHIADMTPEPSRASLASEGLHKRHDDRSGSAGEFLVLFGAIGSAVVTGFVCFLLP